MATELAAPPRDVATDHPAQADHQRGVRLRFASILGLLAVGAVGAVGGLVVLGLPVVLAPIALALAGSLPWIISRPRVVLGLAVASELSNASTVLGDRGVPGVHLLVLAVAAASVALGLARGDLRLHRTPLLLLGALFLLAQTATAIVASDQGIALAITLETARSLVFLALVMVLASASRGLEVLAGTAVATVAVLGLLALLNEILLGGGSSLGGFSNVPKLDDVGSGRHAGPLADANFWGRNLVLVLPVALSAWVGRLWAHRWPWAGAVLLIGLAIELTKSRGALIAGGTGLLLWLALAGGRWRRALWATPLLLVGLLLLPGIGSRLESLGNLGEATSGAGEASLVGRVGVLKQGLAIVTDNPVTGVGAGNFEVVAPEYGTSSGLTRTVGLAPHNLYLELAAEGGVGLLVIWMLFYLAAVTLALRAVWATREADGSHSTRSLLAVGVVAGLSAWAVASVFLHLSSFRTLLVVVALAGALGGTSVDTPQGRSPASAGAHPGARRVLLPVAAAAAGGFLLSSVVPLTEVRWQASASAVIVPVRRAGVPSAYEYDVASRGVVRATFAGIVERSASADRSAAADRAHLSVTVEPDSAVVNVLARAEGPATASEAAGSALETGARRVADLDVLYQLSPLERSAARPVTRVRPRPLAAVLVAALAAGSLTWWVVARRGARSRR